MYKEMTRPEIDEFYIKHFQNVINKEVPKNYPINIEGSHFTDDTFDSICLRLRDKVIKDMGFAFVCERWIKPLATWIGDRTCFEIMAGSGAISCALKKHNVMITSTDNYSWGKEDESIVKGWWDTKRMWTHVEGMSALEAVEKYGKRDIMLVSWAYMDDDAYEAIKKYNEINPNGLTIIIGEGEGGCTFSDKFFENIEYVTDDIFERRVSSEYKSWYAINDKIDVVRYKEYRKYNDPPEDEELLNAMKDAINK